MSPERRIHRRKGEKKSREPELISWKHLDLITPQEAERLGINSEGPVFVSPQIKGKERCFCGAEFSPIVYHKGIVTSQHYHPENNAQPGGIYYGRLPTKHLDKWLSRSYTSWWLAILDPIPSLMDLPIQMTSKRQHTSSEKVNVLQFRAFSRNSELKEGFLVGDERGTNLFPSINKNHPFITDSGFKIIDGEVLFTKIAQPKPTS